MKKTLPLFLLGLVYSITALHGLTAETRSVPAPTHVGELFGQPVTKEEFDFAFGTTLIFSVSGKEPANDSERRIEAWKHLIFLHEAERRHVQISRKDVEGELTRLLAEKNIVYGSYNYAKWVQVTFNEEPELFEKRIENLLKVKKLIDQIMNPPKPTIREADAKQKFLNQYNSMATEFVNFPTLEEAKLFYQTISTKKWDDEKIKNPKFSTPTGHISLEALIDLWQVPTDDSYRIHAMKIGEIAAPAKMYKGYGVFRLLEKKTADIAEYTEKKQKEYIDILTKVYYYNTTQKVLQDIINTAKLRDYVQDKILVVETNQGTFELQLYPQVAPKACENMIGLAEKGYYDGVIFHRVIDHFMIQGGDPTGTGSGGRSLWGEPFQDEVYDQVQFEKRGILAMANSGPNTNGSQFFITLAPTPQLNKKHTIFGEVTSGYEVVENIGKTPTGENDKPLSEQKIIRLYLKKWA